jgi:uncharacterized membrane protein YesL
MRIINAFWDIIILLWIPFIWTPCNVINEYIDNYIFENLVFSFFIKQILLLNLYSSGLMPDLSLLTVMPICTIYPETYERKPSSRYHNKNKSIISTVSTGEYGIIHLLILVVLLVWMKVKMQYKSNLNQKLKHEICILCPYLKSTTIKYNS